MAAALTLVTTISHGKETATILQGDRGTTKNS